MIKKEGPGWRIIRDTSRENFPALIGGEDWAIELSQSEWQNLVRVVIDLSDQYRVIKDQLMGDEDITLELERRPWLAILKGDQYGWNLKLILGASDLLNRGAEVSWPRNVTNHVTNAMRTMWDSDYL
ncbi:DUF1818 family protein [Prochlorococcus marinus]|uniref:DUF1818 family protein n=1 Tax=Prochlorococcus marinus TaxID=1219 RepID=UPI0022B55682|nr:DUF1818 family protein [Prochlorococcus marinus]